MVKFKDTIEELEKLAIQYPYPLGRITGVFKFKGMDNMEFTITCNKSHLRNVIAQIRNLPQECCFFTEFTEVDYKLITPSRIMRGLLSVPELIKDLTELKVKYSDCQIFGVFEIFTNGELNSNVTMQKSINEHSRIPVDKVIASLKKLNSKSIPRISRITINGVYTVYNGDVIEELRNQPGINNNTKAKQVNYA